MRLACLISLLFIAALISGLGAEEQRTLDPTKPADAIVIVDTLTKQLALPRDQAVALTIAIETLAKAIQPKPVEKKEPEK